MYIFKGPYLKHKDFCPDPVAKYGIPDYANSFRNAKVWGTPAWQEWWEEQFNRCMNGYDTGGMYIPGNYYKFLNFDLVSTVGKGNHAPGFIDFQYDFFLLVEHVKQVFKGIIALKARRKGLSEMVSSIIDSGYRFKKEYHAGVCAGLSDHVDDFMLKLKRTMNLKLPELMLSTLIDNDELIQAGWKEKDPNGKMVERGSHNTIYYGTMNKNPNIFKGKYLEDCVFEESGEFEMLEKALGATKACFMDGNKMVGTPYIYGTGGNMNKGSKYFAEIYHEAEANGLIKFFVSASKMYFPCVSFYKNSHGKLEEDVPNIIKKYKDHERIGMEDEIQANKLLDEAEAILKQKKSKKGLYDFWQNYPRTEKQALLKFSGNNFNTEILNDQLYELESNPRQYGAFSLDFVKDDKGQIVQPYKVTAIPLGEKDLEKDDRDYILIHNNGHPLVHYKDLDIAGIDSYDMDKSSHSTSLGAMVVYRRNNEFNGVLKSCPIAIINCRPSRKEIFYELCFKASIYWNLIGNTMIDAGAPLIIDYYVTQGGQKYLSQRPIEFDAPNGQQDHKWGSKFTTYSKPRILGVFQGDIIDHCHKWVFPVLIHESIDYDVNQKESDWDVVDAYCQARMRDMDMGTRPKDETEKEKINIYALPQWEQDQYGNMVDVSTHTAESDDDIKDQFLRLIKSGHFS